MAGRRGKGEGSIYKRGDGLWVGSVQLGYKSVMGPDGKAKAVRERKTVYGDTRTEVQQKLAQALRDVQQGLPLPSLRETVGQCLERWLETSAKQRVRATTFESYSDIVTLHLVPELGRITLAKLKPQDVQSLLARKLASGLSPRRVQYIRAVLRMALNQALKWSMVGRNVATLVDGPRVQRHEITPFVPEQAQAFLKFIKGDKLEALYVLALASGMRQGELLGLRWQDVDLDKKMLRVTVTLQRVEGKLRLVEPKTDKSRRTLTLPRFAVDALKGHRTRQLEDRLLAGSRWQEQGLVFTTGFGTPLDATKVTRRFQTLLEDAELPRQRFHDLRHACASLLFAEGVPARMVMETLGHSQLATTMDIYTHILPAMRQDVADRMEALLGT